MSDRVVLITGGASGMGAATARAFAEAGARVFVADYDRVAAARTVEQLSGLDGAVESIFCDVRDSSSCGAMVEYTLGVAGRLDVLVNSAGVWVEGPTEITSDADWDQLMNVNLRGVFYCCRAAIPALKQTQGCIVNISSRAANGGVPEVALYCTSKAGVNMLTRCLALELAPHLVRVNAVCPSDVEGPFLVGQAEQYGGGDPEGYLARLRARLPQGERGRFLRPEEVASLVVYLASPLAEPINGECILMDFGISAR